MKRGVFIFWLAASFLMLSSAYGMAQEGSITSGYLKAIPGIALHGVYDQNIYLTNHALTRGGRIHSGNLKIIPGFAIQGVHDDNIYLGNRDNTPQEEEESDWITHLMPLLLFDYSLAERGSLNFGYRGDFAYYNDNDENDWTRHEGILRLDYGSPGGLILGLDNLFVNTEDPYSSENEFLLGQPQVERWYDRLNTTIGFDFSDQLKVFTYYNFYKQEYDEAVDFSQDYKYHEFGAGTQIRLHPKTWGFFRYHYGERDYYTHRGLVTDSNDSDSDYHRVNVGLIWDADAKLGGELNLGYQWKSYDNSTDVNGNPYDDENTWIARTLISYEAAPTTTLGLGLARALREAGADTNEYYEDTGISLNVQQVLTEKLILHVGGIYSNQDYNMFRSQKREDDNYKVKIDLNYQVQDWLSAQVGYQYWDKDSDQEAYDFTDKQFMVSVDLVY